MTKIKGCQTHNLPVNSKTWDNLKNKLVSIINNPDSDCDTPCPLCVLFQLSKLDNIIGQKAKRVVEAYESLLEADHNFQTALDKENLSPPALGTISSLEVDCEHSVSVPTKKQSQKNTSNKPKPHYEEYDEYDEDDLPF